MFFHNLNYVLSVELTELKLLSRAGCWITVSHLYLIYFYPYLFYCSTVIQICEGLLHFEVDLETDQHVNLCLVSMAVITVATTEQFFPQTVAPLNREPLLTDWSHFLGNSGLFIVWLYTLLWRNLVNSLVEMVGVFVNILLLMVVRKQRATVNCEINLGVRKLVGN